jgi:hypothetical protein
VHLGVDVEDDHELALRHAEDLVASRRDSAVHRVLDQPYRRPVLSTIATASSEEALSTTMISYEYFQRLRKIDSSSPS